MDTPPESGPSSTRPPRRTFGVQDSQRDSSPSDAEDLISTPRRVLGRLSFSTHRPSFTSRWRTATPAQDPESSLENGETTAVERPPIPSALQSSAEAYTTPLPTLAMVVLSITMLGEFLSANVSTPFLLFMVKGFGKFDDEAEVAFWTGVIVAAFFMTQFLTSLLWATVAEKHGRRTVLFASLFGSALTCLAFGTAQNIQQAIAIRLLQGIFAGAVGVSRGAVSFITDSTNEGRAYAILGFCWGLGGVAGAIIGGTLERPADKWPSLFGEIKLFVDFPYLLPCAAASSITFTGAFLSLFLGRDGGPRDGAIHLPPEKHTDYPSTIDEDEEDLASPSLVAEEEDDRRTVVLDLKKKVSGLFARRVPDADRNVVPLSGTSTRLDRTRTFSRTSRANGSAYGYGGFRSRLASNATGARRSSASSSVRRRRESNVAGGASVVEGNFAQRLLMANENAVTNIADLWVAAAMNVDLEDPFESDSDVEGEGEGEGVDLLGAEPGENDGDPPGEGPERSRRSSRRSNADPNARRLRRKSSDAAGRPPGSSNISLGHPNDSTPRFRRFSNTPGIFSHTGVRPPPAVLDAQELLTRPVDEILPTIAESGPISQIEPMPLERPPSITSMLPVMVILQYGLLALHSTTHDQIFMSYLVSDYQAGGLNLNAGHFAQLIAMMCLASIFYQFYLYPNIGPPRGRFSHLSMFKIGSLLFVPAYLSVILYRAFASANDDGNYFVMALLALSTAVRYAGMTFAYTSIAILVNYMTPPVAVGYANGIAQSIVSLARCFGPVLGGYLWSVSVQNDPSGYPLGFLVVGGVCAVATATSFLIR